MDNLPVIYLNADVDLQAIVDTNGYKVSSYPLYSLNRIIVRLSCVSNGVPKDLSGIHDFTFGLDNSFNVNQPNLIYVTTFNVDSDWDDLSNGKTSFILDLRTQGILDFIGTSTSKSLFAELWASDEDPICLLYQQKVKIYNTLLNSFPPGQLCGIGTMRIESLQGCVFKIY